MNYDFMRAHGVASEKQATLNKIAVGSIKIPAVKDKDWLKLTPPSQNEEKFIGVYAVHPGSNFIALRAKGAYTVDWGDGVIENFNNNATAEHEYIYNDIDQSEQTLTSRGFKQVIVTVTPQSNHSLTMLDLNRRHSIYQSINNSGFVDIVINAPTLSSLAISTIGANNTAQLIRFSMLERVSIYKNALTDTRYLFYNCASLREVRYFDMQSVLNAGSTFYGCLDLVTANIINSSNVTNLDYMFRDCFSLEEAPSFDTSDATRAIGMFMNCYILKKVPLYDFSNVLYLDNLFYNCYLLETTPAFNTANVISINDMFRNCYSLLVVPEYDFSKVISANNLFVSCGQLYSIRFNNMKKGFSLAYCKLGSEALNELYDRLGVVSNQAITVVGNYGVRADSTGPAVAKGWIVSG